MAYVNIVTSDRGWILERLATEISSRVPYVQFTGVVDPKADIQYYMTYSTWAGRVAPCEVAYFAHQEEDPVTAKRFLDVAQSVDHCVCHARLYEQRLRDHGVNHVTTIPPGVDLEAHKPIVKIGVVGRTYHTGRKGEALVQQAMDVPGLEWHFTGHGWPGPARHIPDGEMAAFYNAMDYILVPALYEGGPMCVVEALACGTPVIAPPVGWVPDFPHISYRTGDAADLRRVLTEVVAERAALRGSVEPYTWDRWAEAHDTLFQSLAHARGLGALTAPVTGPGLRRLRVSLAMHGSERGSLGGPSVRVPLTASRMRRLGHEAQSVFFPDATVLHDDLVHGYNVWSSDTALAMARGVRAAGKPFVFSPIYMDLHEQQLWSERLLQGMLGAASPDDVAERWREIVTTFAVGQHCGDAPREPRIGYHASVREMISLADHVIYLSEHERAALQAINAEAQAGTVIPNPVDTARFAEADPDLFGHTNDLTDFVLCVARVEPRKNQLLLLEALRETGLPVVLIGGETNPAYSRLIDLYSGPRLLRLGRLDPASPLIASAMRAARVVVLPSWCEGAPLAALEAAACGANLVLSNRSSERAYFGALARYCNPADLTSIRDAVLDAWDRPPQAGARRALTDHVAQHFSWERHIDATLDVYADVLRHSRGGFHTTVSTTTHTSGTRDNVVAAGPHAVVIDLTTTANQNGRVTGIARTELSLARAMVSREDCTTRFVAFSDEHRRFVEIDPAALTHGDIGAFRNFGAADPQPLQLPAGARLLILGSAWLQSTNYPRAILEFAQAHKLQIALFVHDVIPLSFPHWYQEGYVERFRSNLRLMLENSAAVLCNSQSTARDLTRAYVDLAVIAEPPVVIRLGDGLLEAPRLRAEQGSLEALSASPGFVLAVGAIHTRKNYNILGEIWLSLHRDLHGRCPKLVIVGGVAWNGADTARMLREDPRLRNLVVLLEDVDDAVLAWLYDHALLTVYPSLYEGWGLPVAESLARGKICVASLRSSIPEVAPTLTDLLHPVDFPAWFARLRHYLSSEASRLQREKEIKAGYQATSWADTAEVVLSALSGPIEAPSSRLYGYLPGQIFSLCAAPTRKARLHGWHPVERWGAWSATADAHITLTLAQPAVGAFWLMVKARIHLRSRDAAWCHAIVNDCPVGRLMFVNADTRLFVLPVPADALSRTDSVEIRLQMSRLAQLDDGRQVGLALEELALLTDKQAATLQGAATPDKAPWVEPGEYLDLTQPSSAQGVILGPSVLRPGWGRMAVDGHSLRVGFALSPPTQGPVNVKLRCRAAGTAQHPQAVLVRVLSGETIARWIAYDDDVREISLTIDAGDAGRDTPICFDVVCPAPSSPAAIGLSEDHTRIGVGLFDLIVGSTEHAQKAPGTRKPMPRPAGLTLGALMTRPLVLAAPLLLSSTWHAPDLRGRWSNGEAGGIALPSDWLADQQRFWLEVSVASASHSVQGDATTVEIWHDDRRVGIATVRADTTRWVVVDAGPLSARTHSLVFWIRTSRTTFDCSTRLTRRLGVFVSRLVFDESLCGPEDITPPQPSVEGDAGQHAVKDPPSSTAMRRAVLDRLAGRRRQISQWVASGDRAMARKEWADAVEHYRKALDLAPDLHAIWVQYGHALKEMGQSAEALEAYGTAMTLQPGDLETLLHLAHLRRATGDRMAALSAFERIAGVADRSGFAAEARTVAREIRTAIAIEVGDAANQQHQWEPAAAAYAAALAESPDQPHIWMQYGHCLKESGYRAEAARAYREALSRAPDLQEAADQLQALDEPY